MSALMSAATTVDRAYYQSFESQTRAVSGHTFPPDEQEILARADERSLAEARQQTRALLRLQEGWNGYDGLPPSLASVDHALHWLDRSYAACKDARVRWYKPNVSASAEGEVVFWWKADDRSLSVYIEEEGATFHRSLDGDGPTQHTHGEAPVGEGQADLMRWFGE